MEYLSLGRIIKTKGLKGVVKIISCTEFGAQRYKKGNVVYLENPQTHEMVKMTVAYYNQEKGFDYVSFEGFEDINLIEPYLQYYVNVIKEDLPPLPKDTYYHDDLVGCVCINQEEGEFGVVNEVLNILGRKSLKIKLNKNGKFIQVPFVNNFIKNVDINNKKIEVSLIKGMIE